MALLPKVKLKAVVNFPAAVLDGTGIDVTKANGSYRFDLDFSDFAPPVVALTDPTHQNFLLWNDVTGQYALASTLLVSGSGPAGPQGPAGPPGTSGTGSGNVTGPVGAIADRIAVYNGTSGTVIKDGGQLIANLAPLASPTFTGVPLAPTPAAGDNSTKLATTAFIQSRASEVNLKDYASTFNGVVDNTTAFNAAITAAVTAGLTLRLPEGIITLTSTVTVPPDLKIVGSGMPTVYPVTSAGHNPTATGQGTWVFINHTGIGFLSNDSALTATRGIRVFRDFGTYRTQPDPTGGSFTPTNHSWDFWVEATTDVFFDNLMLLNATKGVYVGTQTGTGTLTSGGRISFNRIYGQPIVNGIRIDYAYDTCRLTHIHFWPFWWQGTSSVMNYSAANGTALEFGRCDNPMLDQIFCFSYFYGINFTNVANIGVMTGGFTQNFSIGSIQCDFGSTGFHIAAGANGVSGYVADMVSYAKSAAPLPFAATVLLEGNSADIRFGALKCVLSQTQSIFVGGSGNLVRISQLTSQQANQSATGFNHIAISAGNTVTLGPHHFFDGSATLKGGAGALETVAVITS